MAWTTPKTDWETGELVAASDMNAIGENVAALKQVSENVAVYTTTANASLGSSDFADVDSDDLNLTITTTGGDVLVHFHGSVYGGIYLDIAVDGSRLGGNDGILRNHHHRNGSETSLLSFTRLIQNLSAGSHTFKLQAKSGSTLFAGAQFWVREI